MTRAQEQTWLIVAVAIFAHAVALLALVVVSLREPPAVTLSTSREAVTPPPASVTLPQIAPPPIEIDALGEATGQGDSIAQVDAPDVAKSDRPEDFEQAWTRQKPVFAAPSQVATREASATAAAAKARATDEDVEQFGPASITGLRSFATPTAGGLTRAAVATVAESPAKVEAAAQSTSPPQGNPDPAVAGPSDLDAFAKAEGITFTAGGIAAREGREVKLVRPRVDLGFMADATRLAARELSVKVRVETDEAGKPRSVVVLESSGSDVIDDAVRLAVYDSWFGGRMPDAFPFRITFR